MTFKQKLLEVREMAILFQERMLQTKGTASSISGLFEEHQESSWKQSERGRSRITENEVGEEKRRKIWKALVGYYKDFSFYSELHSPCRILIMV